MLVYIECRAVNGFIGCRIRRAKLLLRYPVLLKWQDTVELSY
jgi:hypothetical protein